MYTIILIDDEVYVTSLLKDYIDWSKYNFVLAETFSSADAAIEYMKHNTVNAVITDISLPSVSGIEFAKICHQEFPDTVIGFISAYRDFSYAYEIANMNAVGFILKPIVRSDLETMCENMQKLLESKSSAEKTVLNFSSLHEQLFCQKLFIDMIYNNIADIADINSRFQKEKINISCDMPCSIFEVSIKQYYNYLNMKYEHSSSILYNALNTIIVRNYESVTVLPLLGNEDKLLFVAIRPHGVDINAEAMYNEIYDNVKYFLDIDVAVAAICSFEHLSDIIDNTALLSAGSTAIEDSAPDYLAQSLKYIQENIAKVSSIDEVANYIHLTPAYFGRLFKKKMKKSFNSYLKEQKIEYAKILLKNKELKLSTIASMLGFENEPYFYTIFKELVGCTPTQYRNSLSD